MSAHALLSPSSAHRWLNCLLAPRLEATLPSTTSVYAQEGTLAHTVCELMAKKYFNKISTSEFNEGIKKAKAHKLWNKEMLSTAEQYADHLAVQAMTFKHDPYIAMEVRVDISKYVPEAFGRCDCVMLGENTLIITDYKHGKGEKVLAEDNPQLKLYALGALEAYRPVFGNTIEKIKICIDQPRIDAYEQWQCTVTELLQWGETEVKPKAQKAYMGIGSYNPGSWCRFCRANGLCKAQADYNVGVSIRYSTQNGALLSLDEIAWALKDGCNIVSWYKDLEKKSVELLLQGEKIPGFKLVEGRSSRAWIDQDKALEALEINGIDRAVIYDNIPKTLTQLEKIVGAKKFKELVGEYVSKPPGKPTLALADDKRKEFSGAVADFSSVAYTN